MSWGGRNRMTNGPFKTIGRGDGTDDGDANERHGTRLFAVELPVFRLRQTDMDAQLRRVSPPPPPPKNVLNLGHAILKDDDERGARIRRWKVHGASSPMPC